MLLLLIEFGDSTFFVSDMMPCIVTDNNDDVVLL